MALSRKPVVVGVDGSEHSQQAALWAAHDADYRHAPVHLVLVSDSPSSRDADEQVLEGIVRRCRGSSTGREVTGEIVAGHPIDQLVHRSEEAQLVVVGSRGHGGFVNALIGSVSAAVAMRGACPVVVVRGMQAAATGPVVVGVDNSPGSEAALEFAFEISSIQGTGLVAVQALPDAYFVPGPFPHPDREEIQEQASLHLSEQLSGWATRYPDVVVRKMTTNEHPVTALREAAPDARLVVVGHRGSGGFTGMLQGSVATTLLHHARCPVAVVRRPAEEQAGGAA